MNRQTVLIIAVSLISLLAGISVFFYTNGAEMTATRSESSHDHSTHSHDNQVSLKLIPLTELDGKPRLLGDFDQSVLVINFWAPWCVPCRREIPALVSLQQEYSDQIQVLGLAFDSADNIANFIKDVEMNYPSFLTDGKIPMYNAVFNNQSGSLPFTAIVDREGIIRYTHNGEITLSELRENIKPLL